MFKICIKCKESQTLDNFRTYTAYTGKTTIRSYCKPCEAQATREYRAKHPEYKRIERERYYKKKNANAEFTGYVDILKLKIADPVLVNEEDNSD